MALAHAAPKTQHASRSSAPRASAKGKAGKTPHPPASEALPSLPADSTDKSPFPLLTSPTLHCASAILVDSVSGQVLYEYHADDQRPMASTTKIMTALLFCENVPETEVITASERASAVRDSSLHLKTGEKVSAHDLLRAILMRSANDGCVAAAEHIAGSEQAFVAKMNERASQLGALHTHFANPHGLNAPDHHTTARDLALITRAAMLEPRIREVVCCEKCRISRSMDTKDVTMRNHSHFLGKYPGADGVKTGWTIPAGHCYVGSATQRNWRLISVVLKSQNYVEDTIAMMDYGFKGFDPQPLVQPGEIVGSCSINKGTKSTVPVSVQNPVQIVCRKGEQPQIERRLVLTPATAPFAAGTPLGALDIYVNGSLRASSPLVAAESVALAPLDKAMQFSSPWKGIALAATILATGLVSLRYGTRYGSRFAALTKSARRRRRRLAQGLRDDNRSG